MKGLFGKLIGGFDVKELVGDFLTDLTAEMAEPILRKVFLNRMNAAARVALGQKLERAGLDLQAGEVAKASEGLADVLGDIRL